MSNPNPVHKFEPGVSGNPNGRPPKGYSITETVKAMLKEKPEIKRALASVIFEKALKGDPAAYKLVWQYMDGMPQQHLDMTSAGQPIPILGGASAPKTEETAENEPISDEEEK